MRAAPAGSPRWAYWRFAIGRSAGFPFDHLGRIEAVDAARVADELLALEEHLELKQIEATAALPASFDALSDEERHACIEARRKLRAGKALPREVLSRFPAIVGAANDIAAGQAQLVELRARFEQLYREGLERARVGLREAFGSERLREAVLWQSHSAFDRIDGLVRDGCPERRSKVRERELLATMYLQRYLAKNYTVGFFGLSFLATVGGAGSVAHTASADLIGRSGVFLEHWGALAFSRAIAADAAVRPYLRPRRSPTVFVDGATLYYPIGKSTELPDAYAKLLLAADGSQTLLDFARTLVDGTEEGFESAEELEETVGELESQGLLYCAPVAPTCTHRPEHALARQIELLPEPSRGVWLERLARLESLMLSLGPPRALTDLAASRAAFDSFFEEITATSSARHAGATYGARAAIDLDCSRAVEVRLGDEIVDRLAPIELVLESIRTTSLRFWETIAPQLSSLHATLADAAGNADFLQFISAAQESFLNARTWKGFASDLQRAWRDALAFSPGERRIERTASDLRQRLAPVLGGARPAWPTARFQSPDLFIAAESADAFARGDYFLVLGEVHANWNALASPMYLKLHPDEQAEVLGTLARKLPRIVFPAVGASQMNRDVFYFPASCPSVTYIDMSWPPPAAPAERVVACGELLVVRDGDKLSVRSRDGRFTAEIVDALDSYLVNAINPNTFRFLAGEHVPRVTVDGVVLWRESWSVPGPKDVAAGAAAFLATRRWARQLGLPRHVFVKVGADEKPFLVDFMSPLSIECFLKLAGSSEQLSISEMLPAPHQLWFADRTGARYTAEFRLVAEDPTAESAR